jgi:hypothetical protein
MIVAACLTFQLHRPGFSVLLRLIPRLFAVSDALLARSDSWGGGRALTDNAFIFSNLSECETASRYSMLIL